MTNYTQMLLTREFVLPTQQYQSTLQMNHEEFFDENNESVTDLFPNELEKYFSNDGDFLACINLQNKNSEFRTVPIERIRVTTDNDRFAVCIADIFGEETFIPLRSCADQTLIERSEGLNNRITDILSKEECVKIINQLYGRLSQKNKNVLIKIEDDAVSAIHSNEYRILPLNELFEQLQTYLYAHYSNYSMVSGLYSYELVSCFYEITDNALIDQYERACFRNDIPHEELKIGLRLTSSDIGISGANLFPMLISGKTIIPIMGKIALHHKGDADISKFSSNLEQLFVRYKKAISKLANLMTVYIVNPIDCMTAISKKTGIGKKAISPAIEMFSLTNGVEPCSAHSIYTAMCKCLDNKELTGCSRLLVEEKLQKALTFDWKKYDCPINYKEWTE